MTQPDPILEALAKARPQNLLLPALAKAVAAPSSDHLVLYLLLSPNAHIYRADKKLKLEPLPNDTGFSSAIQNNNKSLAKALAQLSVVWPPEYIAAHYRVSEHLVRAAMLHFQTPPSQAPKRPRYQTDGTLAFLALTQPQQVQLVADLFTPHCRRVPLPENRTMTNVALAIGIPPSLFAKLIKALGFELVPHRPPEYTGRLTGNPLEALIPTKTPADPRVPNEATRRAWFEGLTRAGSVRAYAEHEKISHQKAYKRARLANYQGIARIGLHLVARADRIHNYLTHSGDTQAHTTAWWVENVTDPEATRVTERLRNLTKDALQACGLVLCRVQTDYGMQWVWSIGDMPAPKKDPGLPFKPSF